MCLFEGNVLLGAMYQSMGVRKWLLLLGKFKIYVWSRKTWKYFLTFLRSVGIVSRPPYSYAMSNWNKAFVVFGSEIMNMLENKSNWHVADYALHQSTTGRKGTWKILSSLPRLIYCQRPAWVSLSFSLGFRMIFKWALPTEVHTCNFLGFHGHQTLRSY